MNAIVAGAARFRPMRLEDVAEVMAIETQVYTFGWTAGIFRDCLRVGYSCWVLEEQGEIAGYGVLSSAAGEAHILNVAVRPKSQRKGYGRMLMEHLLGLARGHGAKTVFLEVRPSNRVAIHLYESMGFSQVGLRRGYYPAAHGREDALILARSVHSLD